MPSEDWTAGHPLVRAIRRDAGAFEFFQLLHVIERVEREAPPIGQRGPAPDEAVRLRPALDLKFPAGDLAGADWRENLLNGSGQLVITTTFLGLYGSDSPLPTHVTEELLRETEDDQRVREFIDLIHHRLLSLLYRVWKKYRYYVNFRSDGRDPISQVVRGLLGVGTPHLDERLQVNPVRLFRYAGLLVQRPRSAAGLVGQLEDYFEHVSFDLEPCVGRWLWIEPGNQNRIGLANCRLGQDMLLGEQVFDRSGKFRIRIGPVGLDDYERFLPIGDAAAQLAELVHFYCDDPLQHDVEVTLRGAEVPETPLGERGVLGRLGWTAWLKSEPCADKSVVFSGRRADRTTG